MSNSEPKFTPGPWQYVPGTEHHGPYVTSDFGSTICDCYTMTLPAEKSTLNGGPSKPVSFMHEMADPNARLIAEAPAMLEALSDALNMLSGVHDQDWENRVREKLEAILSRIDAK